MQSVDSASYKLASDQNFKSYETKVEWKSSDKLDPTYM